MSQRKAGRHYQEKALEHDGPELTSGTNRPLSFAVRSESEGGYGAPPKGLSPHVRRVGDHSGDSTLKVITTLPSSTSATSSTPLRPNRLGPNGDIELGGVEGLPGTGVWINDWTSWYKSPLGKSLILFYLPVGCADDPQMLCNGVITDSPTLLSSFFASG